MNHEMRDIPFDFKAIDKGIKEGAMGKACLLYTSESRTPAQSGPDSEQPES